jgi:hypothetical protein
VPIAVSDHCRAHPDEPARRREDRATAPSDGRPRGGPQGHAALREGGWPHILWGRPKPKVKKAVTGRACPKTSASRVAAGIRRGVPRGYSNSGQPVPPAVGRQRPRRVILATPKAGGRAAARRISPRKEADLDRNLDGIRYAFQDTGDGGGRAARELRCSSTFQSRETAPISPRRCRFVEKERGSRPILQNPMGEM